ncbi:MAG TPA: BatA domain-containing protein [Humisphaera sp.]|jgi:hypothetical protein|nr:BatA domain-containing protein [Humisphaera sp.]
MFFNPLMLVGLGAAVLPLVLHLLSRARYKQVEWGAMMFLQSADSRQRMAARAAQYFLLAARMGIIALLAVTLARPVVQGRMARAAPGGRVTAALLLDCSASMGYDENGRTRFQMAQAAARQILRGLQSGDRVCLILMGLPQSEADLEPTGDLRAIETRIDEARIGYSRANLQESLIRAADVLERYEKSNRDVYVVCDRQALSWKEIDERFAADWRRRLSAGEGATADQREARMFVFPVGGADADNVSIESIRLAAGPAIHYRRADGTAAPVEVEVAIHNYGNVPRIGMPLTITVSGNRGSISRSVNLGTNQLTTVNIPIAFERAGSYVVAARLKANGYTGDDHLESVVNVVDPIHVLVIDGDGPGSNFRAAADFLSWALAPRAASDIANGDPFDVTAIAADQWADRSLQQYSVIILANVDQFSTAQARALEQYVYSGGGLLVAPGSLCRSDDYNAMLYRDGAGILPARLEPPTPSDGSQATTLLSWDVQNPAFAFLRGQFEAPAATVARYFPAKARQIDATPLAWYLTGDPFLIEGRSERGRVLLMTTALDADWTTMPLSNFYLPFVQSAVRYLASGSVGSANLLPGQPIRLPVMTGLAASEIRLIRPDGRPEKLDIVRITAQPEVRYGDTQQPGEYQVRIRQGNGDPQIHYFIVRPPREESDLTQLTDDRWKHLEQAFGFQLLDPSVRPLRDSMAAGREGREVWAYLLAGVLGLIILELLIARHWSIPIGGNGRGREAREQGERAESGDRLDPLEIYASVGEESRAPRSAMRSGKL